MPGRLIVVTGTGTDIGKTHVACALLERARRVTTALGYKPIETGATGDHGPDGAALLAASHPTFHVKPPPAPYVLPHPVSPHLAARDAGRTIDPYVIAGAVRQLLLHVPFLVVELAGGLFSPLALDLTNADLVRVLAPTVLLLVAPDRLGVLHDVAAADRAARAAGLRPSAVVLVAPARPDASSGTNADEIPIVADLPVFAIPRAPVADLAMHASIDALYEACTA